jgi:hypothetical protein
LCATDEATTPVASTSEETIQCATQSSARSSPTQTRLR